jgi:MATE family multidrug resistance protein
MSTPTLVLPKPIKPQLSTLLTLAWPIIISRASQVVVGLSDAFMIAHLGENALAATTTGAMNAFTLFIFPMGVVFIVSSFSSQLFGKRDAQGALRFGCYGLVVAFITFFVSLASLPLIEPVLSFMPYTPEVRSLVGQYLRIRLLSSGMVVGIEALGNYYGGLGNTRLPMVTNLLAMGLNLFGNWVFIDGHLGFTALGVQGAAWASTLATTLAFLVILSRFILDTRGYPGWMTGLKLREFSRMLRFGIPSGLNWFLEFLAFAFFINVVVAGLGTTALAGMMAVMQINTFSFMPAFALASAGSILAGQAIGSKNQNHVPPIAFLTLKIAAIWQGLVGIMYFLIPEILFAPFAPSVAGGEALRATGTRLLMLSAMWQLFDATATTMAEILRSAGDTAFTLWARVILAWTLFVPGSYLTTRYLDWATDGAVFWLTTYLLLLAVILFVRFSRGAWRSIHLTDLEPSIE